MVNKAKQTKKPELSMRRKEKALSIRKDEELFRIMADTAPVLIWLANAKKERYYFNKGWLDFTGRKLMEELGDGWADDVHPEDYSRFMKIYNEAFDKRERYTTEYRLRRADGEYRWILATGVPRHTSKGKFEGFIGSCIDITEKKEQEMRKNDFISMASHELKTPVTTIKIYTQYLREQFKKSGNQHAAEKLDKVDRQVERLNKLICDLLDVSKAQAGKLLYEDMPFDLQEVVVTIVGELKESTGRRIVLKGKIKKEVFGDPGRIEQVVFNVLSNAIKFSPSEKKIIVTIEEGKGAARVHVADQGIGIPRRHQEKIFDRFFRVYDQDDKTYPGLGIGLYIASEIIKRHKGSIWVRSKKGEGSTFSFSLPLIDESPINLSKNYNYSIQRSKEVH